FHFFFYGHVSHPHLHSFPTRRSSDLFKLARLAPLLKHLAVPDEAGARVRGEFELLRQFEARRRARLLAERAEHAARGVEDELVRSEEHTSELQSLRHLVCRLLLEKKN